MKPSAVHVRFTNPRWAVVVEHEDIARSHHADVGTATEEARALARRLHTELVVFDPKGKIVERCWYGVLPL
jgi:hypothetical protein